MRPFLTSDKDGSIPLIPPSHTHPLHQLPRLARMLPSRNRIRVCGLPITSFKNHFSIGKLVLNNVPLPNRRAAVIPVPILA